MGTRTRTLLRTTASSTFLDMDFSARDFLDRGFKRAHGRLPELVEVSAQAGDAFRIQLVEAAGSCPAVGHQSRVFEDAQMLGDRGAADGEGTGQFVHGYGAARELVEDGHAGGVPEGIKSVLKVSVH